MNLSGTVQSNLDAAFGFRPVRQLTAAVPAVQAATVNPTTGALIPPATAAVAAQTSTAVALANEGTNVILGPTTVSAVLHALYDNARTHEENAPLVITEDNQPSTVRVVTRTPIVVSTVTATTTAPVISSDVRYYLDPSDSPRREIGTTLIVTPSILPDNTIRLAIDGTVASIVGEVPVQSGGGGSTVTNNYPIVNEAHLVNLSRVPSGYSLILGGFVTIDKSTTTNKVPVLGDIPLLGQAFRYKQVTRARTNLAFIITPIAFPAGNTERAVAVSEHNRTSIIGPEHNLDDPDLVGRVNDNTTDFRNALSTGQYQESDKNPVTGHKKRKPKKQNTPQETIPQTQPANPEDQ